MTDRKMRRRRGCTYFADGFHRFAWRKVYGKHGWHCLCPVDPSPREVELLTAAEAKTEVIRDLRWGSEHEAEQTTMAL